MTKITLLWPKTYVGQLCGKTTYLSVVDGIIYDKEFGGWFDADKERNSIRICRISHIHAGRPYSTARKWK